MTHAEQLPSPTKTHDLSKTPSLLAVPDLTGLQRRSFESFAQLTNPGSRACSGLEGLLQDAFAGLPGNAPRYEGYEVQAPDFTPQECEQLGRTYAGRLLMHLRQGDKVATSEMGRLPLMTRRGTFIVRGREKVVVGQLRAQEDDEVCDLATRRLALIGQQLEEALARPLAEDLESVLTGPVTFPRLQEALQRFFSKAQNARTTNPLTLISHTRLVVQRAAKGSPGYDGRCVHPSHFGRLCPLETPEGDRIGINLSTAVFADVAADGTLLTPYCNRDGEIENVHPGAEADHVIGDLGPDEAYVKRYGGGRIARKGNEICRTRDDSVDYVPAHPCQALGASASLIPLLAHDDANRALMGANMQKQAVPLATPEAPIVQTGMERQIALDSGAVILAEEDGVVNGVNANMIAVQLASGESRTYGLRTIVSEGHSLPAGHRPVVAVGDKVAAGQLLADGPATDNGVLALGRNVLVGYLPWYGYNFEDGVVVSDHLIRAGLFTSIWTRTFTLAPNDENEVIGSRHLATDEGRNLGSDGIVKEGSTVNGGDVLIARATGDTQQDTSLRLPHGQCGTVVEVVRPADGTCELVRVTVAAKRDLTIGDKLCNRHGAKGVVTHIVPEAEMPVLPDGRRLEVIVDPLGVPSRMNIGSVLEAHLGLAAHELGSTVITPCFNGANTEDITAMLTEAGLPASGMLQLRDGRTGRPFDQESTVGYVYMMKLDHMVEDKCQARAVGPYDAETEQPVGGRARQGGKRIGIMETWALQAHGAAATLQEFLTIKSDSVGARDHTYGALVDGKDMPRPTVPVSIQRLAMKLRGLCLNLQAFTEDDRPIDLHDPATEVRSIAKSALAFADADTVRNWSTGAFAGLDSDALTAIELARPVQHAWREHALGPIPQITSLPVLPHALRGGRHLDRHYQAVVEANDICREQGLNKENTGALQVAVDGLLNGLTEQLYGKRGWITAAISGKTVDYAGRSVICPGPDLDHDTCSIPAAMAAALLEPIAVGVLVRNGAAASADQARAMLRDRIPAAMEVVAREASKRYVLLHRAPVLHRMGMQAFRMKVANEDVVRVHPLTQVSFNADFDGDEMEVFLPLSDEAQGEARELMRSSQCQVGPANGVFINAPTQDMVLGCYYATCKSVADDMVKHFVTLADVTAAFDANKVGVHAAITLAGRSTTVGRALFNGLLPEELRWVEAPTTKEVLRELCAQCWRQLGNAAAAELGDALMRFGFRHATLSGMSLGKDLVPRYSKFEASLAAAWQQADEIVAAGDPDGYWDQLELWTQTTETISNGALSELAEDLDGLNPVHAMLMSGARGSRNQIRQLVALRGLMAMPNGRIMPVPFTTNFLTGHSPFEYFASTFGARKGLVDTALKTADAGFLFKRVMNAVQDLVLAEADCGATEGLVKVAEQDGQHECSSLRQRITGRTALEDILAADGAIIVASGETIDPTAAAAIEASGRVVVAVRSPVTCTSEGGVCAKCYGLDPSSNAAPGQGLAVGVIAAQSIGEPCTQLTMRTFHCGHASRRGDVAESQRADIVGGLPRLNQLLEAWSGRWQDSNERDHVTELCGRAGVTAAAEYLLAEV